MSSAVESKAFARFLLAENIAKCRLPPTVFLNSKESRHGFFRRKKTKAEECLAFHENCWRQISKCDIVFQQSWKTVENQRFSTKIPKKLYLALLKPLKIFNCWHQFSFFGRKSTKRSSALAVSIQLCWRTYSPCKRLAFINKNVV